MLDVFNLPNNENTPSVDIQTFIGRLQSSSLGNPNISDIQTWRKPRGIKMLHVLCIGGGSGGGGGQSAATGTNKAGGGGGGSGALSSLLIPAFYLPDKLYVLPGYGGVGGPANSTGIGGTISYVLLGQDSNFLSRNLLITSSALGSGQSSAGAQGAAGTGGTGGGAGNGANTTPGASDGAMYTQFGVWASFAGNGGANGGSAAAAGSNSSWTTGANFLFGGSGGGGSSSVTDGAGGSVTLTSFVGPVTEAIPAAALGGGNPGSGGFLLRPPTYPLFGYGGMGGSGANGAVGGKGGNGAPGCGGGGGGSGTTGGAGGDGGPGLIIFTCW